MKFKTDDAVGYDNNVGIIIAGWPASDHRGYTYQVHWLDTGLRSEVWESDLIPVALAE